MNVFNIQTLPHFSTEQVIANHISVQAASEITGYNAQYLRRILRDGKLNVVKVGHVWLINLASFIMPTYPAISA